MKIENFGPKIQELLKSGRTVILNTSKCQQKLKICFVNLSALKN